ncbi:hypothetical protein HPB49_012020 [Dermacentor silvarum]|uniref:Uncharacterized protein n=1 Tax=Dermacentor silvarum TaxID=543639 RepID=A0ACB8DPA8_DERSI|nr:hypothetical protein HPB49_012020 [Dermacentor silvarum]
MVPWRDRLSFRRYIPGKVIKYEVKLFKACTKDGYTLNINVYAGKSDRQVGVGHAKDVCLKLMQNYKGVGRTLYVDNSYTSLPLALRLLKEDTFICGTVRSTRKGLPKEVSEAKVAQGSVTGLRSKDGVKLLKWMDKRPVLMLTSVAKHEATLVDSDKKTRDGAPIPKPQAVLDYNAAKKGMEYSDQMASYYSCLRKGLKWYGKVAVELLVGSTIVNAWNIRGMLEGMSTPIIKFREELARSLFGPRQDKIEKSRGRKCVHTLEKTGGSARNTRRRCTGCYAAISTSSSPNDARVRGRKVTTFCGECPGKPFMCLSCFNSKHK